MHGDHATENLLPPEAFPSYFNLFRGARRPFPAATVL